VVEAYSPLASDDSAPVPLFALYLRQLLPRKQGVLHNATCVSEVEILNAWMWCMQMFDRKGDPSIFSDPTVKKVAEKLGKPPARSPQPGWHPCNLRCAEVSL
jgi:hypothetical protein